MSTPDPIDDTYSLGATSRITGISAEVLRAWERRHGVVVPLRTDGGTRRYRASDLERLSLVKRAVDLGHRIGRVAALETEDLEGLFEEERRKDGQVPLDGILDSLERLDAASAQQLLTTQFACLGAQRFCEEVAVPLLAEIGERWAADRIGIAPEHLVTGLIRSVLGTALHPTSATLRGPHLLFGTTAGERHELGLLMAAVVAAGAGANVTFLGADLPVEEFLHAVDVTGASVVVLALSASTRADSGRAIEALRGGLREDVAVWLGGAGSASFELIPGVERITSLGDLDRRVSRLIVGGV
jgi:DNA-binding transcriptional MerR regulator/methylmalonyl-CoA mutase cobalamin-binding subunit